MANYTEAYDLELFAERPVGNAVPKEIPRQRPTVRPLPKEKIVELPKKDTEKQRKAKKLPLFKSVAMALSFVAIFGTVVSTIYSQVCLTELTSEIAVQSKSLQEAEAVELQLAMSSTDSISAAEIEKYAREQLGMSKVTEGQVVYLNMASKDRGEVIEETDHGFFSNMIDEIKSWFS